MIFFITGGSRGIGADLVTRAIKAGHDVAFTYIARSDRAEEVVARAKDINPDAKCKAYQLDVRKSEQVDEVVKRAVDDFDTVDVLVNNAGLARDSLVMNMENEEWDDVIATNLTGPFYVTRAMLPTMLAARFGRIINMSSVIIGGATGQSNYAAAKAGLHGFTKSLAKEYGRRGITANVIVPGFFETEMTVDTMPQGLRDFWKTYSLVPKGRGGKLEEITAAILFLASKEAAMINGQELRITAGLDWTP